MLRIASTAPAITSRIIAATATHAGLVRRHQADAHALLARQGRLAAVVADGAGDDETAAAVAADAAHWTAAHALASGDPADALLAARGELEEWTWNGPFDAWYDRTAAVVAAVIDPDGTARVGWLGDARVYRLPRIGILQQLTVDHNPPEPYPGAFEDPRTRLHYSNILDRHIGDGDPDAVTVDPRTDPWWRILLCSDGLTKYVEPIAISDILNLCESAQEAADELVDEALNAGGRDNITVTVLEDPAQSPTAINER